MCCSYYGKHCESVDKRVTLDLNGATMGGDYGATSLRFQYDYNTGPDRCPLDSCCKSEV